MTDHEPITTEIWQEKAHADDPFVADKSLCYGYDVYKQLLGRADLSDYLLLLLFGDKPSESQKKLFNAIAIAIGNQGPRELSVRAAMTAAAGGSSPASCLIAALGVGSGNYGGSNEIQILMNLIEEFGADTDAWEKYLSQRFPLADIPDADVNPPIEHPPGFSYHHKAVSSNLLQCVETLSEIKEGAQLSWVKENFERLNKAAGCAMQMPFLIAAGFKDLNMYAEQAEFCYLFLRLPGALAHGLEQRARGWRDYPFHGEGIKYNPPKKS